MPDTFQSAVEKKLTAPTSDRYAGKALNNSRYPVVEPDAETLDYFKKNPSNRGMAIGAGLNGYDGERRVVVNPYSGLTSKETEGLIENERIRLFMDETKPQLDFEPTKEQMDFFKNTEYGKPENVGRLRETLVARILTGDGSAGAITPEQQKAADLIGKQWYSQAEPSQNPATFESAVEKKISAPAATTTPDYGKRPDGSKKGKGWLGVIDLGDGNVATEYSTQSDAVQVGKKRIDFPTLVPTLTPEDVERLKKVITGKGAIPEDIMQKAIEHARKQLAEGKSVFSDK